jgi:hypothetical protein
MPNFSLGFKSPGWRMLEVGIGKPLTNARIKQYIREGRYGQSLKLALPKSQIKPHVKHDRKVRSIVDEYNSI